MTYANRQYTRLKSALWFYRKRHFPSKELADKAGALAIRLLALDTVHKEQAGAPMFPAQLREGLLRLVMVTEPDKEPPDGARSKAGKP